MTCKTRGYDTQCPAPDVGGLYNAIVTCGNPTTLPPGSACWQFTIQVFE